jgi:hypothetical protein
MPKIDYMKMISILSKTLKMETIDIKFVDNSEDKLEITLGGAARQERRFELTLSEFSVYLTFPAELLSPREFETWRSVFEYEMEQAYLMNVCLHVDKDFSHYVLKMKL